MTFLDSFFIAIRSIRANKTRSALTMLGVVIGIASVIILVAIGEASKQYIVAQVKSWGMGPNVLQINPGKDNNPNSFLNSKLKISDADLIKAKSPSVSEVVPVNAGSDKVKYGKKEHYVQNIWGTTDNYQKIYSHKVIKGRFFNKGEVAGNRKVAVIGDTVAKELFGNFSPIGEKIKIQGKKFNVIGIFEKKGKILMMDMDNVISLPITSAMNIFNSKQIIEIDIAAKNEKLIPKAISEINEALGMRLTKDDYHITTQEGMMNLLNSIVGILTSVIGGIAAISLVVGGIGIMNIMLVSVTERTKEIGIRKAVGARKRDIFVQFLVESVVVSFLGGIFGIILGLGGTFVVMYLIRLEMVVVLWALTLACSVSIAIGVISGVYPAMRAVSLDPIEALRYE